MKKCELLVSNFLGRKVTNTGKNFEHDTNLCNRMCVFNFSSHNLSGVCENMEEGFFSKNGQDV